MTRRTQRLRLAGNVIVQASSAQTISEMRNLVAGRIQINIVASETCRNGADKAANTDRRTTGHWTKFRIDEIKNQMGFNQNLFKSGRIIVPQWTHQQVTHLSNGQLGITLPRQCQHWSVRSEVVVRGLGFAFPALSWAVEIFHDFSNDFMMHPFLPRRRRPR
jgi:hypothetical protein